MRLNVYVSHAGLCSRRQADEYIFSGKIKVNNKIVRAPWFRVKKGDKVAFEGRELLSPVGKVYLVMNKPPGYICTLNDKFAAKKITDLLPENIGRVYPVGRLDKNSRGLLLLTNDGDFMQKIIHPRHEIEKEYVVWVSPSFSALDFKKIRRGILTEKDCLTVKSLKEIVSFPRKSKMRVVLTEGRKRHIRRIFENLGYRILSLKRVRIGKLKLGYLREGEFRVIPRRVAERALER